MAEADKSPAISPDQPAGQEAVAAADLDPEPEAPGGPPAPALRWLPGDPSPRGRSQSDLSSASSRGRPLRVHISGSGGALTTVEEYRERRHGTVVISPVILVMLFPLSIFDFRVVDLEMIIIVFLCTNSNPKYQRLRKDPQCGGSKNMEMRIIKDVFEELTTKAEGPTFIKASQYFPQALMSPWLRCSAENARL
ncbi:hypothetical protein STEG23_029066 [Scotinomys teguina]